MTQKMPKGGDPGTGDYAVTFKDGTYLEITNCQNGASQARMLAADHLRQTGRARQSIIKCERLPKDPNHHRDRLQVAQPLPRKRPLPGFQGGKHR